MDERVDLSVILPIYNEVGHLREEIDRIRESLDASRYSYEIIVIDDGSTDGSTEALREIEGITMVRFATNRGSGFARRHGTKIARGTYVAWTDVDMTYPNNEMPRLMAEMDGYDHVVGARQSEEGTLKFLRVPAKWFIRKLASYLSGTKIADLNSGLRIFRRDVALQYLHLLPNGFSCVTTLTLSFLSNGYTIKFIPIEYFPRAGSSKFHWWTDTRRYLLQVVRMTMLYNPLKILMPLGILVGLVGVGKSVFDVVTKDFRLGTNTLALLLASLGLIIVALLADLIVQMNASRNVVEPAAIEVRTPDHEDDEISTSAAHTSVAV